MSDEYQCPRCGGLMEEFCDDENVDYYNFDGWYLACEDCSLKMPREAYGFSSQEEYEEWFDRTYEHVYADDEGDEDDEDDDD